MSKIDFTTAVITEIRSVHLDYLDMTMKAESFSFGARPGQFIMIKGWTGEDPLLPRPFDIVETDPEQQTLRIVVKVIGKGTALLKKLKAGDEVKILGPLGKPVTAFESADSIGLLSRGVGAAAVVFLAKEAARLGKKVFCFMSASTAERLVCREDLEKYSTRFEIATDDGSEGYHGNAFDLVDRALEQTGIDQLYTCGSKRFARYIKSLEEQKKTKGYVFLERVMACGMGHCHGCAVPKKDGSGYLLLCQDGPVFPVGEIELE